MAQAVRIAGSRIKRISSHPGIKIDTYGNLAAGLLQKTSLITYVRGKITILDRIGLESVSCECYQVVRQAFDRLDAIE